MAFSVVLLSLTQFRDIAVVVALSAGDCRLRIDNLLHVRIDLASKANVLSQEAQVKQAAATFKQSEHQYQAGTKASIDRNKSFVEYHTEQQRLFSLRGDLVKQTMQLARLIGLPVGQVVMLSEDLPAQVPEAVSLEAALKLAFEERSDLKAARLQLKAASEAHRASMAEYLPSLGVKGDYGLEGVNPNKGVAVFQAAATITIPIFKVVA